MNESQTEREDDESYRTRIAEAVPEGAWYTLEDLGDASSEQLDAIGQSYGVQRRGG